MKINNYLRSVKLRMYAMKQLNLQHPLKDIFTCNIFYNGRHFSHYFHAGLLSGHHSHTNASCIYSPPPLQSCVAPLFRYLLKIMETCQESVPTPTGPGASPAEDRHIDLTEDLAQQLEDIISTYQAAQIPAEPEDIEEVTAAKEPDARKDQKLEKKMLKSLGLSISSFLNRSLILRSNFSDCSNCSPQSTKILLVLKLTGV